MGDCNMFLENKRDLYENNEINAIEVYQCLPKLDCKKCGYQSCLSFATKLLIGDVDVNRCAHIHGNKYNLHKVKSFIKVY